MNGDMLPRSIEMAREIRRGDATYSPSELYAASSGRGDVYRHAMHEAGFVVPRKTGRAPSICQVCRYDFGVDAPRRIIGDGLPIALTQADLTNEERRAIEWVHGGDLQEQVGKDKT